MARPTVFGPGFSTYVRSVRLALEEKGVDYALVEIDALKGAHKQPEHLARHPFGKVPAFEHDGFALYETSAILRYVDEAFAGTALQPGDARGRARMQQVIGIIDAYGYPALITGLVMNRLVAPMLGGAADEAAIAAAVPAGETALTAIETLMGDGQWLAGPGPSLADLHLAPIYAYVTMCPEAERLLMPRRNLTAWWARMSARPSMAKTAPNL